MTKSPRALPRWVCSQPFILRCCLRPALRKVSCGVSAAEAKEIKSGQCVRARPLSKTPDLGSTPFELNGNSAARETLNWVRALRRDAARPFRLQEIGRAHV